MVIIFALAALLLGVTLWSLISVSRAGGEPHQMEPARSFKQKLIDINKVPDPKGRGTIWTPSE